MPVSTSLILTKTEGQSTICYFNFKGIQAVLCCRRCNFANHVSLAIICKHISYVCGTIFHLRVEATVGCEECISINLNRVLTISKTFNHLLQKNTRDLNGLSIVVFTHWGSATISRENSGSSPLSTIDTTPSISSYFLSNIAWQHISIITTSRGCAGLHQSQRLNLDSVPVGTGLILSQTNDQSTVCNLSLESVLTIFCS